MQETYPVNFFILLLVVLALRALNAYLGDKRIPKALYATNGKVTDQNLLVKYYDVLGLDYKQAISLQIVSKAFHKQLELLTDDRLRGYKPTYSLKELQAAKAYLIDFCDYTGKWN